MSRGIPLLCFAVSYIILTRFIYLYNVNVIYTRTYTNSPNLAAFEKYTRDGTFAISLRVDLLRVSVIYTQI